MLPQSSRNRSLGELTNTCPPIQNWTMDVACTAPFVLSGSPFGLFWTGELKTMTDVVTPDFQKRKARGEFIMNPMQSRVITGSMIPGNGYHLRHKIIYSVCGGVNTYKLESKAEGPWFAHMMNYLHGTAERILQVDSLISHSDIGDLQKEVSTKVLAGRGSSDNNLYETLAEYNQTVGMMTNPFKSVNTLLTNIEKGAGKGLGKFLKEHAPKGSASQVANSAAKGLAGKYLAFRYGVMPLIKDITGIIQGLEKNVGSARTSTRANGELSATASRNLVFDASAFVTTYGIQTSESVVVRALSIDEYVRTKAHNIGFGMKGLITLPYELIPYSFVFDWFVNLGDFLNALVPLPGLKNLGSCITTYHARQALYTALGDTSNTWTLLRENTGSCFASIVTKTRSPFLHPSIVLKHDFKLDSAVRAADAVSLIVQRMGSMFGKP